MKKGKKLSERIERERTKRDEPEWHRSKHPINTRPPAIPSASKDTQLGSYVESFVSELETLDPLPKANLMTPESARAAIYVLNQKLAQLERYKKTAEALKSLLLSHGSDKELN